MMTDGRAVNLTEKPRPLSLTSGAISDVEIGKVGCLYALSASTPSCYKFTQLTLDVLWLGLYIFRGHHSIHKISKFYLPLWILAFCREMQQIWLLLFIST